MYIEAKAKICGYLSADPELRVTPSGLSHCSLSIPVKVGGEQTTWWRLTAWGRLAELIQQEARRGDGIEVSIDRIRVRPWSTQDGRSGVNLEAVITSWGMIDPVATRQPKEPTP